jgi:hypothetical protein
MGKRQQTRVSRVAHRRHKWDPRLGGVGLIRGSPAAREHQPQRNALTAFYVTGSLAIIGATLHLTFAG